MSLKKLQKFFELQAEENNCEVDDLWMKFNSIEVSDDETGEEKEAKKKPKKTSPKKVDDVEDPNNLSAGRLAVAKKAELVALCRYHELKIGGKMDELKDRLKEFAAAKKGKASPAGKTLTKEKAPKGEEKKKASPPKKAGKKATPEVLKKIAPVQHRARKNKHGNYVLANYGLVMDDETQTRVIGVQADDGSVVALEETDIETCKMLKLQYDLPDNLDTEADLDQTQVDGIEDHADEQINALAVAAKKKGKKVVEENDEEEQPEDNGEEESEVEDEESEMEIVD